MRGSIGRLLCLGVSLVAAVIVVPAQGVERHVPSQYVTIQAAINAAATGDEVVIAPGTYTGYGNHGITFGGKAITVRSVNPNDPAVVAATVIDGQGDSMPPGLRRPCVAFQDGEGPDSVLAGLTIANNLVQSIGGGIRCDPASPTIRKCVITKCSTSDVGGGIFCSGPSGPVIEDSQIIGNTANNYGGGLYCETSTVVLRCVIADNMATSGGGIGCGGGESTTLRCIGCVITNNSAQHGGGTFSSSNGSQTFINCIIAWNTAQHGGFLYCENSLSVVVVNSILFANWGGYDGGAINVNSSGRSVRVTVANSILRENNAGDGGAVTLVGGTYPPALTVRYSDVQGGRSSVVIVGGGQVIWGDGNIDADPMFTDADGADNNPYTWEDNDFRLQWASPCIDTGNDADVPAGVSTDIDGDPRILDGNLDGVARVDMGADEFTGPIPPVIDVTPATLTQTVRQSAASAPSDTLTLHNVGSGMIHFTVTDNADWLSVTPDAGTCATEQTITVAYATASLALGTHTSTITVRDPASWNIEKTIAVTLDVVPVAADFNADGDVDLADFNLFVACFNGPNNPPAEGCPVDADFDDDGDVSLSDFSVFTRCFNGPNRPPACVRQ